MKLRINWGTGIAIFIVLFLLTMVFLLIMANRIDIDLVEKDYYPRGINYQDEIDARANLLRLGVEPVISPSLQGLGISLPDTFRTLDVAGSLVLYRPNDITLDLRDTLVSADYGIDSTVLVDGQYTMILHWVSAGVPYHWEKTFQYRKQQQP